MPESYAQDTGNRNPETSTLSTPEMLHDGDSRGIISPIFNDLLVSGTSGELQGSTLGSPASHSPESYDDMNTRLSALSQILRDLHLPQDSERYLEILSTIHALVHKRSDTFWDYLDHEALSMSLDQVAILNEANLPLKVATFHFAADIHDLCGFRTHNLHGYFWNIIPLLAASCARNEPDNAANSLLQNIRQEKLVALDTVYRMLVSNDSDFFIILARCCLPSILPFVFHEDVSIRRATWDILLTIHELKQEVATMEEDEGQPLLGLDLLKSMSLYLMYGDLVMPTSCKFNICYMQYAERDMRDSYVLPTNVKFHKMSRIYPEEAPIATSGVWDREQDFPRSVRCDRCRTPDVPLTFCSLCFSASYCSPICRLHDLPDHRLICEATVLYMKALIEPKNPFRRIRLYHDASLQILDRRLKLWIACHRSALDLTTIRALQLSKEAICFATHIVRFLVRPCKDQGKGQFNSFQIVRIVVADLSSQLGSRSSWTKGVHLLECLQRQALGTPHTLTGAAIECLPLDIQILPVETARKAGFPLVPESVCLKEVADDV